MPAPSRFHGRLVGKVAIVTGAGGADHKDGYGTGQAIALLLAGEGAAVTVVDTNIGRAEYSLKAIEQVGGRGLVQVGDVSRDAHCQAIAEATLNHFGHIDILVNNAGIRGGGKSLTELNEADWQRVLDVNLKGTVLMTRHCVAPMVAQSAGSIINISSIGALRSMGAGFAYGPSKAAIIAFTNEVAVAYGRAGIRANSILPGHLFTPIVEEFTEKQRLQRCKVAPLGVRGDAWDIAFATLFLAGDEARFITGQSLCIDGGVCATMPLKALEFAR